MTTPTHAIQDGPDFYLFDSDEWDAEPIDVIHAPKGMVRYDFDLEGAIAALDWFEARNPSIEVR